MHIADQSGWWQTEPGKTSTRLKKDAPAAGKVERREAHSRVFPDTQDQFS